MVTNVGLALNMSLSAGLDCALDESKDHILDIMIYTCDICKLSFKSFEAFVKHNLQHVEEHDEKYDQCEECFVTTEDLRTHQLVHSTPGSDGSYSVIKDELDQLIHSSTEGSGQSIICPVCSVVFSSEDELETHSKLHIQPVCMTEQRFSSCNETENEFMKDEEPVCTTEQRISSCNETANKFTEEEQSVCMTEQTISSCNGTANEYIKDEEPHETYISQTDLDGRAFLKESISTHQTTFDCDICDENFACKDILNAHVSTHHKTGRLYKCDLCRKMFNKKSDLITHRRGDHAGQIIYRCSMCGKKFTRKASFIAHGRIHMGGYKCFLCGMRFTRLALLMSHARDHNGKELFRCEKCKQRLVHPSDLKSHTCHKKMAYRTSVAEVKSENQFQLPPSVTTKRSKNTCQFDASRPELKSSRIQHPRYTSHQCDVCKKRFTDKHVLSSHKRIHSVERPFICDLCELSFVHESDLQSHTDYVHKGITFIN